MPVSIPERSSKTLISVMLVLTLSGCELGKFVTDALNALGLAEEKTVQVSGEQYFKLDKGDPTDAAYSQNGHLCVVHYPGCGVGEDGEDTFFEIQQLPPTATVEALVFEPIPPNGSPAPPGGWSANYLGPNPSPGSFGTRLQAGPGDGSAPIRIKWQNACSGPYGGKAAVYRVSIKLKIRGNLDFGEPFDPSKPVPACRSSEPGETTIDRTKPSGFLGSVTVCNAFDPNSVLHLKAQYSGSGTTTNKTDMNEDIPVTFLLQTQGRWTAEFRTQQTYQQGNWTISSVALDGNYGTLPGLPRMQVLPGGAGAPTFDFTGGPCEPR